MIENRCMLDDIKIHIPNNEYIVVMITAYIVSCFTLLFKIVFQLHHCDSFIFFSQIITLSEELIIFK